MLQPDNLSKIWLLWNQRQTKYHAQCCPPPYPGQLGCGRQGGIFLTTSSYGLEACCGQQEGYSGGGVLGRQGPTLGWPGWLGQGAAPQGPMAPTGGIMPLFMPPSNQTGISSPSCRMKNLWLVRTRKGSTTIITSPKITTFLTLVLNCSMICSCYSGERFWYMLWYSWQLQVPSLALLRILLEKPWKERADSYCLLSLASERTEQASLISLNLASLPGLESGWYILARRQQDFLMSASELSLLTSRMLQQSLEGSNLGTSSLKRQADLWVRALCLTTFLRNFLIIITQYQLQLILTAQGLSDVTSDVTSTRQGCHIPMLGLSPKATH